MQQYVRFNNRLALFRTRGDQAEHWDSVWHKISEEQLVHILRPTKRLGSFGPFFRQWLPKDGLILEAGCGTGLWVQRIRNNGGNCIGIDFAVPTLERTKVLVPSLPLAGADVFNLPFPDNSLDCYLSFGVIEHFPEGPTPILQECARVLRPRGVALISVPYDSPVRKNTPTVTADEACGQGLEFYQYYFTPADIRQELQEAQLVPINAFHGYGTGMGLAGPLSRLSPWARRLGPLASLIDWIPVLPRFAAHMFFTVSIKPGVSSDSLITAT